MKKVSELTTLSKIRVEHIERAQAEKGMNKAEFSEFCEISSSTYASFMGFRTNVSDKSVNKILESLELPEGSFDGPLGEVVETCALTIITFGFDREVTVSIPTNEAKRLFWELVNE